MIVWHRVDLVDRHGAVLFPVFRWLFWQFRYWWRQCRKLANSLAYSPDANLQPRFGSFQLALQGKQIGIGFYLNRDSRNGHSRNSGGAGQNGAAGGVSSRHLDLQWLLNAGRADSESG
jgi:hypothetical protein